MNVFILNTGRCGSVSFIKACSHISNFQSGHETRTGLLGKEHFNFPDNYIEADNRLSWFLGRLDDAYGDDALYVHLKRDANDVAKSFTKRYWNGIIKAYSGDGILRKVPEKSDPNSIALDYVHTINSNIEFFLKDKSKKIDINIENVENDFPIFWKLIGAEGNLQAAMAEFSLLHNASKPRMINRAIPGILQKIKRIILKLPAYIRSV